MLRLAPLILLAACGARAPVTPPPPPAEVEMEPILVTQDEAGELKAFDAQGLFDDGQAALARQDWAACDTAFEQLAVRFPNSKYTHPSLYNRGLCLERMEQHVTAARVFRLYAQLAGDDKDRLDGEFRLGFNLVRGKQYPDALHLYDALLGVEGLAPQDKAECYLRRGTAWMFLDKPAKAEQDLKLSMAFSKEAYAGGDGIDVLAEAHFRRAEIYQRLAHKVRLKLPVESMRGDLAAKVRFFRRSQSSYIDALNVRNSYWATAAGLRLGELYEQFYRDVLSAEVPAEFDKMTRRFYIVELKKKLQPLLEQSLAIYEKNITLGERIGAQNEWLAETEARVKALRTLIEENARAVDDAEDVNPKKPSRG